MAENNQKLHTELTRPEFEALIDQTLKVTVEAGLKASREELVAATMKRFAALRGTSVEEAEQFLDRVLVEPTPEPTDPEELARREQERGEALQRATRAFRERAESESGPYFYESPEDTAFQRMFFALRREGGLVANLLVTGPSGCGKTEGLRRAGQMAGMPVYKVDCASITTSDRWVGHKEIDEKGTHYILSEHLRWVSATDCEPGLVIYDEINRLHPTLLNILFPLLDGSQRIWVPDLGIHVDVHPQTIFAATANIGAGFSGTHRMDDALTGRFGFRMERNFPPIEEEVKVLVERTGVDEKQAKILVDIATQTRNKVNTGDLSMPVATRNLLDTSALVAAGMTIQQASEFTFVKFFSEDGGAQSERAMVRQIVVGKSAGK